MNLILKSIEEEAIDCRVAWKGFDLGTFALHCHHEILAEPLREEAENRIAYILSSKPKFEQALRLRLFRPVSEKSLAKRQKAYAERKKAYAECEKADADLKKADAEWKKAYADLKKADAEREKADAKRNKAYADLKKAYAKRNKAYADLKKAYAEREKADADLKKADAEWEKAYAELAVLVHTAVCKNCPWNGKTIFPKENQ